MNLAQIPTPQNGCACEGHEKYSPLSILYENVVIFVWIGSCAALMRHFRLLELPVLSLGFLLWCAVMLGYVLRRQLCSRCYYYDMWCHCGWGKYAALVVPKAANPTPVTSKLAPMFWFSATGLPIVAVGVSLALSQTTWRDELVYLVGYGVCLALSGEMHVRDCKDCRMRRTCPGSAARK